MNGKRKPGFNSGESLSPSMCPTEHLGGPGCNCTTVERGRRSKWSQEVNGIVTECYYTSNTEVVGYKERMIVMWKEKGMFYVKEILD